MHFLLIVAGTNHPSNADVLADHFGEGLRLVGNSTVEKIRLEDLPLEHFTLKFYEEGADQGENMRKLWGAIEKADGILIASPIWNFSVPSHLKNALDRIGAYAMDKETRTHGLLKGKPFFFLYTGGAPLPVWKGIMRFTTSHVPESIRYYAGSVIGRHFEGKCMQGQGKFGLVVHERPQSLEKAKRKGQKFAHVVSKFVKLGRPPLRYRFIEWAYDKGKRIVSKI